MKTLIAILALSLTSCSVTAPESVPSAEEAAAWREVVACYNAIGYDTQRTAIPHTVVREDCRSKWSAQDFYSAEYGGWVFGQAFAERSRVEVCPDLKALRHEMSHVARWQLTGDPGENGAGVCWL